MVSRKKGQLRDDICFATFNRKRAAKKRTKRVQGGTTRLREGEFKCSDELTLR